MENRLALSGATSDPEPVEGRGAQTKRAFHKKLKFLSRRAATTVAGAPSAQRGKKDTELLRVFLVYFFPICSLLTNPLCQA